MKIYRTIALLTALLIASSLVSCSSEQSSLNEDISSDDSSALTQSPDYDYPDVDYENYEFRILNFDYYANCNVRVDITEQTGEKLDDAIYARNRKVEDKLGFRIKEIQHTYGAWSATQKELISLVTTSVMADDDEYDAAYLNLNFNVGAITDGCLVDLTTVDELKLDEDYWDVTLNDSLKINGKLYGASGPLQLETFDLAWCMFFNEDMMTNLKMEYPYQLVRDGKWTLDKLYEYVSKAASLNGDENFTTWQDDGNSVYGIAGHYTSAKYAFLYSLGCDLVKETNGEYAFVAESDRFYTAFDKLKTLLSLESGYVRFDNSNRSTGNSGYMSMFANSRALFMTAELKSAMEERDMADSFGILPFPKLDENDEYRTQVNGGSGLLCIPKTNPDLSRTGVILDALTYESNQTVLPIYYDVTVSQKGLRNEDSIEMLEIIKNTRGCEVADFFNFAGDLASSFEKILAYGSNEEPASLIAKNKSVIEQNINNVIEAVDGLS